VGTNFGLSNNIRIVRVSDSDTTTSKKLHCCQSFWLTRYALPVPGGPLLMKQ